MQYSSPIAYIIDAAWFLLIVVWVVTMFSAKRNARGTRGRAFGYRLLVIVAVYAFLRLGGIRISFFLDYIHMPAVQWLGAVLVYAGVALAIWARVYLGRNWGMPMTEKEGAELVTTGPYAYIRNPIYSGILLAVLGSALALGVIWAIVFVGYAVWLLPSVFVEEKIMLRLFPDAYPAYKARTKRLIPGVW